MNRPNLEELERNHQAGSLVMSCAPDVLEIIAYARELEAKVARTVSILQDTIDRRNIRISELEESLASDQQN